MSVLAFHSRRDLLRVSFLHLISSSTDYELHTDITDDVTLDGLLIHPDFHFLPLSSTHNSNTLLRHCAARSKHIAFLSHNTYISDHPFHLHSQQHNCCLSCFLKLVFGKSSTTLLSSLLVKPLLSFLASDPLMSSSSPDVSRSHLGWDGPLFQ